MLAAISGCHFIARHAVTGRVRVWKYLSPVGSFLTICQTFSQCGCFQQPSYSWPNSQVCVVYTHTKILNLSSSDIKSSSTNICGVHHDTFLGGMIIWQHRTHSSSVLFLCWTLPSICHWNYFQTSKDYVTWNIWKVNIWFLRIVVWHMRVSAHLLGHMIRVYTEQQNYPWI